MIHLLKAAIEIQSFLEEKNRPFCFIGGIAVIHWGEIRVTNDLDIALLCGFGNEIDLIDLLQQKFSSRIPDAKSFAVKQRVLLLRSSTGVPIDITLTGLDFEEQMIKRSSKICIMSEYDLQICSAEDLIVMKAFANRGKDWGDIESIILKQQRRLDTNLILVNISPLAAIKEDLSIIDRLNQLLLR